MPLVYVLLLLWWLVRAAAMAWQLARYSCVKHYSLCDDEGAAPAARRAMHALKVDGQIRFESGAAVLAG